MLTTPIKNRDNLVPKPSKLVVHEISLYPWLNRQGDFVDMSLAAEPLLSLAVTVTSEQRVKSVLRNIVQGLASQPGVALTRIWLLPSADLCGSGQEPSRSPEQTEYLRLVASAGTPVNSPREDWSFLQGHFSRLPLNVGKVGQVAANRNPILCIPQIPSATNVLEISDMQEGNWSLG